MYVLSNLIFRWSQLPSIVKIVRFSNFYFRWCVISWAQSFWRSKLHQKMNLSKTNFQLLAPTVSLIIILCRNFSRSDRQCLRGRDSDLVSLKMNWFSCREFWQNRIRIYILWKKKYVIEKKNKLFCKKKKKNM